MGNSASATRYTTLYAKILPKFEKMHLRLNSASIFVFVVVVVVVCVAVVVVVVGVEGFRYAMSDYLNDTSDLKQT